jgi:hypothetical protein
MAPSASFTDPDGYGRLLQEIKKRLPGRTTREPPKDQMTDRLLEALKSTAAAQGVHEKELGRPDADCPRWYAVHVTRTLGAVRYQLAGPSA